MLTANRPRQAPAQVRVITVILLATLRRCTFASRADMLRCTVAYARASTHASLLNRTACCPRHCATSSTNFEFQNHPTSRHAPVPGVPHKRGSKTSFWKGGDG
eukprot:6200312-Pleurochrysis_carterae.AAC.2